MDAPPSIIDGAPLVQWTTIDEQHAPTGFCRHIVGGELVGPAAALAVCQYPGDHACYLFYCDDEWSVITDTLHESLADALEQAEGEYVGVSATWTVV